MTSKNNYRDSRNDIVDAVKSASPASLPDDSNAEEWAAYSLALRDLADFDARHGGTPVL
jgi:hypothetical protein